MSGGATSLSRQRSTGQLLEVQFPFAFGFGCAMT